MCVGNEQFLQTGSSVCLFCPYQWNICKGHSEHHLANEFTVCCTVLAIQSCVPTCTSELGTPLYTGHPPGVVSALQRLCYDELQIMKVYMYLH